MDDDTTVINPSIHKESTPISKKKNYLNNLIQITRNLFKGKEKNSQAQKIKHDLIQNYIDKSNDESISDFQKILHFFKTKK